jgi:hypothetical protein
MTNLRYYSGICVEGLRKECVLKKSVGATHIESSASQSAWTTAAPTPIGSWAT